MIQEMWHCNSSFTPHGGYHRSSTYLCYFFYFLYEGPLIYSYRRNCTFLSIFSIPRYIDILATSYFFATIKLGLGRVLFSRCSPAGGWVLAVRELFIADPRRTDFPLFLCLLWIMSDDFSRALFLSVPLISLESDCATIARRSSFPAARF